MVKGLLGTALACAALAMGGAAIAAPQPAPSTVPGWDALVDDLRTLPDRLLAKLPAPLRDDPQIKQEVARLALASLASNAIEAISADGDHPAFLPNQNLVLNFPMPNADTTYRIARLTPGGAYRLRGRLGNLRLAYLSQFGNLPGGRTMLDLTHLHVDAQGRFELIVSPERPSGYKGDWWALQPATERLLLRQVADDWNKEVDPTLAIERIDRPPQRPRPSAAELEARLRALPEVVSAMPLMFVGRTEDLAAEGYVNRMKVSDLSQVGGVRGQLYYDSVYDLGPEEALLMEVRLPPSCRYFSAVLGNELHQTVDWVNNHSSLNDTQARPDADGVLRIVVSAADPGVANWLDTAGYSRGLLQGRTICDASFPAPTLRKLSKSELSAALPLGSVHVTPAEREAIIRDRRAAVQQRPLW